MARALLRPCPSEAVTFYRVSRRINSPANDDLSLIEPLDTLPEMAPQPRLL